METPITTTYVSQKILSPTWTPTAGIRVRYLKKGIVLPQVVPAGPNNPRGRFAMRLGIGHGEYLIHGTNAPDSVGLRVSSGCIRMNAKDIKTLFSQVTTSTRAAIINEPVKYTREPDVRQYIEVDRPLAQRSDQDTQLVPITLTSRLNDAMAHGDDTVIDNALRRRAGYPVMIPAWQVQPGNVQSARNGEPATMISAEAQKSRTVQ